MGREGDSMANLLSGQLEWKKSDGVRNLAAAKQVASSVEAEADVEVIQARPGKSGMVRHQLAIPMAITIGNIISSLLHLLPTSSSHANYLFTFISSGPY